MSENSDKKFVETAIFERREPLNSLKTIYYNTGVDLGKIVNQYSYKVNVPCENCHSLIRLGIDENISFCPICHAPWNGNSNSKEIKKK